MNTKSNARTTKTHIPLFRKWYCSTMIGIVAIAQTMQRMPPKMSAFTRMLIIMANAQRTNVESVQGMNLLIIVKF